MIYGFPAYDRSFSGISSRSSCFYLNLLNHFKTHIWELCFHKLFKALSGVL
jgi:hypothetical protein